MAQICDYSSLIFAGNTTVLLILSLTTDYWEYRSFDMQKILTIVKTTNETEIFIPFETDSYFQIKFKTSGTEYMSKFSRFTREEILYHAPLFVKRRFIPDVSGINETEAFIQTGATNLAEVEEGELNMFQQYGNLFRDCDALEGAVRVHLGLIQRRPEKCVYFEAARKTSDVYMQAPELTHLESSASAAALLCIVTICIGSFAGAYGLFSNYTCFRAFTIAACMSLVSGFFLTLCIALFHGKCHILRKMEILPGHEVPFKATLNAARLYGYGWSFILAWICVFFCYTSSYVWLYKSQGYQKGGAIITRVEQKKVGKKVYRRCQSDELYDIATV